MSDLLLANWFSTRPLLAWSLLGIACGGIALGLLVLMRSRWVQSRPLSKYVLLSVCAHVVLLVVAGMTNLFHAGVEAAGQPEVIFQLARGESLTGEALTSEAPWEEAPLAQIESENAQLERAEVISEPDSEPIEQDAILPASLSGPVPERAETLEEPADSVQPPPSTTPPGPVAAAQIGPPEPDADLIPTLPPLELQADSEQGDANESQSVEATRDNLEQQLAQVPNTADQAEALTGSEDDVDHADEESQPIAELRPVPKQLAAVSSGWSAPQMVARHQRDRDNPAVHHANEILIPTMYRARFAVDRLQQAMRRGGSQEAEAAVQAALQWLARNQNSDGRWDASALEAGRQTNLGGHSRPGAGIQADTGITGLAILVFLGAGQTHRAGEYQDAVRNAIDFLLREQARTPSGSLAGSATHYAATYCHGIAALALSEAFSLTRDARIEQGVQRAIGYTVATQDSRGGGWRYRPHEVGDTSQFGWQLMALTSAHYGGISIPGKTWSGARGFLGSVSSGSYGGLASYRAGEMPSKAMTAEALLCRLILGTAADDPLVREAADAIVREAPGSGRVNYYYWYYGTLALYHLQGHRWTTWNTALQGQLLQRQRTSGSLAGSWDTDTVWGRSGGRVYTTALAALSLEVYYRFVPLHPKGKSVGPVQSAGNRGDRWH